MKQVILEILKEVTEKTSYQSLMLTIIGAMVGLIAWGGNNMYSEQREYNQRRDTEITNINKNQIIIDYRVKSLEKKHDKDN